MMNKKQIGLIGETFAVGFTEQMGTTELGAIVVGVGLHQGLKYNGSLKRGVVSGLATLVTISTYSGVRTVIANKDLIKNAK